MCIRDRYCFLGGLENVYLSDVDFPATTSPMTANISPCYIAATPLPSANGFFKLTVPVVDFHHLVIVHAGQTSEEGCPKAAFTLYFASPNVSIISMHFMYMRGMWNGPL